VVGATVVVVLVDVVDVEIVDVVVVVDVVVEVEVVEVEVVVVVGGVAPLVVNADGGTIVSCSPLRDHASMKQVPPPFS